MSGRRRRRWPWLVAALLAALVAGWLALRTPDIPAAELRAKYANAASTFVTVEPGLAVHVRDEGPRDAPVLVLLHGSNASLHTWEPWVARLAGRTRVVTLDLPGHGLTGAHPRRDYSDAAFVAVVDAVARARARFDRFVLGGNSMGGGIAWRYALAHPSKLDGLILVDAGGAPTGRDEGDLPLGFRIARTPVVRDVVKQITPRSLIETSLRQSVSAPAIVTPAMVDRYWELLRHPGNRDATMDRFSRPRPADDPARLVRTIRTPTLVMWGREDKLIPVAAAGWFAGRLPDRVAVIYDGVGHIPMEELPDRSAADVRAFLDDVLTRRPPRSPSAPPDSSASAGASARSD